MNYEFNYNGHTYKSENAIRILTTAIGDECFGNVMRVVLWRTVDGLYYFTLEDIVSDGYFYTMENGEVYIVKNVHCWVTDLDNVRYWMRKNDIELAEIEDARAKKDKALYEAIMNDLCPDDD